MPKHVLIVAMEGPIHVMIQPRDEHGKNHGGRLVTHLSAGEHIDLVVQPHTALIVEDAIAG